MGVCGYFLGVTPDELARCIADDEALDEATVRGERQEDQEHRLDIGKAWDGLHFLLTGASYDEGRASGAPLLFGGTDIEDSESAGAPIRYMTPAEVQAALAWMKANPPESVADRYDAAAFSKARIYPGRWGDKEVALDFLLDAYEELIAFYEKEAALGKGVLFWAS